MNVLLPPLPAIHTRAMALMMDAHSSLGEIATVIEADPHLTASILRTANSVAFAVDVPAVRVSDALVRIGLRTTRSLVVAALLRAHSGNLVAAGLDIDSLWSHLLACALLADKAVDEPLRGVAFAAGMLHDIGRLAMAAAQPNEYQEVVRLTSNGTSPLEAERNVFGHDHAAIGGEVAAGWSLPEILVHAVRHHHSQPDDSLTAGLVTGRRIASVLGYGDGVEPTSSVRLTDGLLRQDLHVLASVGGPKELKRRIEWFKNALNRP